MYKEYEAFTAIISEEYSFEDMISNLLNHMVDMLKTRFSSLLFMVVSLGETDIKQLIREDRALFTEIRSGMNEFITEIYKIGRKEKVIGDNVTAEDCRLVLNGILSSFTNEVIFMRNKPLITGIESSVELSTDDICKERLIDEDSLAALKDRTVRLILKALR